MIHGLQFELVQERLVNWKEREEKDLLEGLWLVATYQYPDLDYSELKIEIEQLYHEIWREYKEDYAPLDQINASNFDELEQAWIWRGDNFGPTVDFLFRSTPIYVDGLLYTVAGRRRTALRQVAFLRRVRVRPRLGQRL